MNTTLESKRTEYAIGDLGLISEFYRRLYFKREGREIQLTEPKRYQVEVCKEWLKKFSSPRKTSVANKRMGYGSYSLKHTVERWSGVYVSNGAFILAVHELGYKIIPDGPYSPNATFCLNFSRNGFESKR